MTLGAIAIFWVVAMVGLRSPRPVLPMLFFATLPLGSFAVVPPSLVAGFSLVAPAVAALLLTVRQLFFRSGGAGEIMALAVESRTGRLLISFLGVAIMVTLFAPRFFAGSVDVIRLSAPELGPVPLMPTGQNLSQSLYLTASVLAVFTFAAYFRSSGERRLLLDGLMVTGAMTVVTGVLDLASSSLRLDWLLSPFRTAEYQILDDQQLPGGIERIVGLMPEPAAFGHISLATLSLLYFMRNIGADPNRRRWCNRLLVALVLMVVLSTSSAALAGLGVLGLVVVADWALRSSGAVNLKVARDDTTYQLKFGILLLCLVIAAALFTPRVLDPVFDRVELLLVEKSATQSFDERSMWTQVSYDAALETSMVGAGLGSTRASNYAVALFASTGLAGVLLYGAFAVQLLRRRPGHRTVSGAVASRAMKWSFPPLLAVDLLVGTTPDFGVVHALRWGVLLAVFQSDGLATFPSSSTGTGRSLRWVAVRPPHLGRSGARA